MEVYHLVFQKKLLDLKQVVLGLGVLGTFVGILIALLGFDTSSIDESIGPLLRGLTTAFTTSVWGMFGTVVLHSVERLYKPKEDVSSPELEALKTLDIP